MEGLVATRYAKSLFEVGVEEKCLDTLLDEMMSLKTIFSENADMLKLLGTPVLPSEEKLKILGELFEGRVSVYVLNFLKILTEKHRIASFDDIAEQFRLLYNKKNNIQEVVAITAIPLSEGLFTKLKLKLEQITGKTVVLENRVAPDIMGGIIIKMENDQIDASVKNRIEELKQHISAIIA